MLDNAEKLPDKELEDVSGGFVTWTHPAGHPTRYSVIDDKGKILQEYEGKTLAESRAAAQQYAESIGVDSTEIPKIDYLRLKGKNKTP